MTITSWETEVTFTRNFDDRQVVSQHALFPKDTLQHCGVTRLDTLHHGVHLVVEMSEADRIRQASKPSPRRRPGPNLCFEHWIPAFAGMTIHTRSVVGW